ncbi:hypothetical protein B0T17DRAFT_502420 [Bombardia bombarda]|uniref:SET domain-containing protein n=1 Tax=Bombardia bombarda TaxID=252184 RepID=A0AA39XJK8_9PEZI|nr:hypothetical protein B0T17DRAFT_502420 [Bombardia bombarda]
MAWQGTVFGSFLPSALSLSSLLLCGDGKEGGWTYYKLPHRRPPPPLFIGSAAKHYDTPNPLTPFLTFAYCPSETRRVYIRARVQDRQMCVITSKFVLQVYMSTVRSLYGFLEVVYIVATATIAVTASTTATGETCAWRSLLQNFPPYQPPICPTSRWQGPEQCIHGTCVFTNYHIGGGSVAVTHRQNTQLVHSFTGPTAADDLTPSFPPFHESPIPGKGIGLIASRTIRKGEIVMYLPPTMIVELVFHVANDDAETSSSRAKLYELALAKLPARRRDGFMGQLGRDVHDKINTNCFRIRLPSPSIVEGKPKGDNSHLGCYPDAARFNHDCRPNLTYRMANTTTHTTVALRDIPAGEELTISYIVNLLAPRAARRASLLASWGFNCSCPACSDSSASDARLARIGQLEAAVSSLDPARTTAETGAQLAALYEQEGLDMYLGHAYTQAALNYAVFGKTGEARRYARMAVEAGEREKGVGHGDEKGMRVLAERPGEHWTAGVWEGRRRMKML